MTRRALIFAHYDPHGVVDDHVIYALTAYRAYFEHISFITTNELADSELEKLLFLADRVIMRTNIGYDFNSWKVGFKNLQCAADFDEVIFANDSCYGPVSDMDTFWSQVEGLDADLWGVSLNRQYRPHVQSFFMGFGRRLVNGGFARRFWDEVYPVSDKPLLIQRFEIGLSARAEEEGYKVGAVVDLRGIDMPMRIRVAQDNGRALSPDMILDPERSHSGEPLLEPDPNPMQMFWSEALRHGAPLVKVELLRENPPGADLQALRNVVAAYRRYDLELITTHLQRVAPHAAWLRLVQ